MMTVFRSKRGNTSPFVTLLATLILTGCAPDQGEWHAKSIRGLMPPLDFRLTDEQGRIVTASDYRGKITALFFGFTNCPDYCPTTLARLRAALERLGSARDEIVVLFVSVDPGRDTPAHLADYTASFAPEVVGLTGSVRALETLTKRYRTTFSYGEPDEHGYYSVSHGLGVYVFDRRGEARLMILGEQGPDEIARDLGKLVAE